VEFFRPSTSKLSPEVKIESHESKAHITTFLAGTAIFAALAPAFLYGAHKYDQKIEQENRFNGKKFEQVEELKPWVEAPNAIILPTVENNEEPKPIENPTPVVEESAPIVNQVVSTTTSQVEQKPAPVVKPVVATPKINAPKPATYKTVDGKKVCEKKNDHPTKSKVNNKGKIHMDMECCLDPDEFPNPWCTYDPKKYGKYLDPDHQAKLKEKASKK